MQVDVDLGVQFYQKKISFAAIKPNNAICSTTRSCKVFQNSCPEAPRNFIPMVSKLLSQDFVQTYYLLLNK